MFPFESVELKFKDGAVLSISGKTLSETLQYSGSYGLDGLVAELKTHQTRIHSPKYSSFDILVTAGSQDALTKAFLTVLNPGDTLLTEDPTYSGALAYLDPLGVRTLGVPIDGEGIVPELFEELLQNFKKIAEEKQLRFPKVLYTIPTGQNPSGATLSTSRRKKIFEISRKYNLLILEDDPYWNLRLNPLANQKEEEALESFFSMDHDERVVRFDSFSKIVSSGIRVGWATGPKAIIESMQLNQQATSLHASGLSQQAVLQLLTHWGPHGFDKHVEKVRNFYSQKRDFFLGSLNAHVRDSVYCAPPMAGMFGWMKVKGVEDTEELIKKRAVEKKVIMLPGKVFSPNFSYRDGKIHTTSTAASFVRASFSTASAADIDTALKRFGELLRENSSK